MNQKTPIMGSIMKVIACTPNKNFDENDYNQRVIEPTKILRKLYEELGDTEPSKDQMSWALSTLKDILVAKLVEKKEIDERLEELKKDYNLSQRV